MSATDPLTQEDCARRTTGAGADMATRFLVVVTDSNRVHLAKWKSVHDFRSPRGTAMSTTQDGAGMTTPWADAGRSMPKSGSESESDHPRNLGVALGLALFIKDTVVSVWKKEAGVLLPTERPGFSLTADGRLRPSTMIVTIRTSRVQGVRTVPTEHVSTWHIFWTCLAQTIRATPHVPEAPGFINRPFLPSWTATDMGQKRTALRAIRTMKPTLTGGVDDGCESAEFVTQSDRPDTERQNERAQCSASIRTRIARRLERMGWASFGTDGLWHMTGKALESAGAL